jgi:hypothetical protein
MAGAETKRELRQVTVATVRSLTDAQRIRAVLDGEKIDSVIVSESAVATSRSEKRQLTAICVQVSRAQVARAVEILRAHSERARAKPVVPGPAASPALPTAKTDSAARTMVPAAAAIALILGLAWLLVY